MDANAPLLLIVVGAAGAGFVQGLSGFGFSLVALSFWAWALDPQLAAVLAVFGGLSGQLLAAFTVRRGFDARLVLPFIAGGLLGLPLGLWLLPRVDATMFRAFVGTLLALWCPVMLFSSR
ncbi:MAG: TSUP family transporter, partial [Rubrivivax sp.]